MRRITRITMVITWDDDDYVGHPAGWDFQELLYVPVPVNVVDFEDLDESGVTSHSKGV